MLVYRKTLRGSPPLTDARQFDGLSSPFPSLTVVFDPATDANHIQVPTSRGTKTALAGWWLIKRIDRPFEVMSDDDFNARFRPLHKDAGNIPA